jgi:hypothetical protein
MYENEVFQAFVRGMRREFERQMIAGIRTIRLELELLSKQDRIDELEASEWARLEPLE